MEKREIFRIENNQEIKIDFKELRKGDKFKVLDIFHNGETKSHICTATSDWYINELNIPCVNIE